MKLNVEIKDSNGGINRTYELSKPAFVKHSALSGCYFLLNEQEFFKCIFRCIGIFFYYGYYLQKKTFDNVSFSNPKDYIYDPTEKSHFSNLAGKAIADFLSKRIDKSIFTVNYEAAMKVMGLSMKKEKRPDLLAFSKNNMFAIEAKGYSAGSITKEDMEVYVKQSQSSKISVDFCVASVSYHLYKEIKCKYHKNPSSDKNSNNGERQHILKELSKSYYSEFLKLVKEHKLYKIGKEEFYKIDLSYEYFERYFSELPLKICLREILNFCKPKLIIPKDIEKYAEKGLTDDVAPFEFESNDNTNNGNIYIDNDRIGIELNCDK